MPTRKLQLTDGKSDKFWTISLKGSKHTVVYGRTNTRGRSVSKTFRSPAEARSSYTKLTESKLKKGYRDVVPQKKKTAKTRTAKKVTKKASVRKRPVKQVKKKPAATDAKSPRRSGSGAVTLNDLKRRMNMFHCEFRDKRDMVAHCRFVWIKFFRHTRIVEPWVDAAVWEIGSQILVRPASTALDESHRAFVRPLAIYSDIRGYKQELKRAQKQGDAEALEHELMQRMQDAILKGLLQSQAQKMYAEYNPADRPFSVLVTKEDKGLLASDFTVIWKNRRGLNAAQIHQKQAAMKGKEPEASLVEESVNERTLANLKESRKREREASRKYWAKEEEKAEQRKPAVRKKLAAQIERAEAQFSKTTKKKAKRKASSGKYALRSLDDGNQHGRQFVPNVDLEKLVHILATYPWAEFNEYDNRFHEYFSALISPQLKKAKTGGRPFWEKLNRAQKTFYALFIFDGDTSNGGVWQFLFNNPELVLAAMEAMQEIGEKKLARDYRITLEEYFGKSRSLSELHKRAANKKFGTEKQWQAFAEGYQELKTAEAIGKYYYTVAHQKAFYKRICDFVEQSFPMFARVRM